MLDWGCLPFNGILPPPCPTLGTILLISSTPQLGTCPAHPASPMVADSKLGLGRLLLPCLLPAPTRCRADLTWRRLSGKLGSKASALPQNGPSKEKKTWLTASIRVSSPLVPQLSLNLTQSVGHSACPQPNAVQDPPVPQPYATQSPPNPVQTQSSPLQPYATQSPSNCTQPVPNPTQCSPVPHNPTQFNPLPIQPCPFPTQPNAVQSPTTLRNSIPSQPNAVQSPATLNNSIPSQPYPVPSQPCTTQFYSVPQPNSIPFWSFSNPIQTPPNQKFSPKPCKADTSRRVQLHPPGVRGPLRRPQLAVPPESHISGLS
nr:probable serine/threonine-protein kinase samkC [Chelonoidis abingdonii]